MNMACRDRAELLLLAAVWGASFLFMRAGAADFGPLALVFVRVAGASLVLLPLLVWRGDVTALRQHWRAIAVVGLLNSALPFALFTLGALALTTGLMAVFNATAPIWAALVAWGWLRDKPGPSRMLGLVIGLAGVVGLCWGKADFKPGLHGVSPALGMAACAGAAVLYGIGANLSRRYLQGVPPMAVAAGSQMFATLALALPALWAWPTVAPPTAAWWSAGALAVVCTAIAYVLYFRLIAHAGAAHAMSVALLIPMFAMAWGWLFLHEQPSAAMLLGCAVILLGTALSTGLVRLPLPARRAKTNPQ